MEEKKSKLPVAIAAGVAVIAFSGGTIMAGALFGRKNTLNTMAEMADKRVQMIEGFIDDAKQNLAVYADSPDIKQMLVSPEDEESIKAAQEFTEYYSEHIDDLEGIYASDLSTRVLAHTNSMYVGMTTRVDIESRKQLMQSILDSEDEIYANGIIISPASGTQIVSMYKLVNGDDGYTGYAGLGVMADSLFENDIPALTGVENASYTMINVDNHKYLFNADPEAVGKEVTNESILSLCSELSGTEEPAKGNIEYKEETDSYIAAYSFMPEYGMLVMVEGKAK